MPKWWKEVWSDGSGAGRAYCGIARTVDGYAVDLFRGDSCVASDTYATRAEAERAAAGLRPQAVPRSGTSSQVAKPRTTRSGQLSRPRAVA